MVKFIMAQGIRARGRLTGTRCVVGYFIARRFAMKRAGQSQLAVKTRVPRATDFFVADQQIDAPECRSPYSSGLY
jgi:hypothetical protein